MQKGSLIMVCSESVPSNPEVIPKRSKRPKRICEIDSNPLLRRATCNSQPLRLQREIVHHLGYRLSS